MKRIGRFLNYETYLYMLRSSSILPTKLVDFVQIERWLYQVLVKKKIIWNHREQTLIKRNGPSLRALEHLLKIDKLWKILLMTASSSLKNKLYTDEKVTVQVYPIPIKDILNINITGYNGTSEAFVFDLFSKWYWIKNGK